MSTAAELFAIFAAIYVVDCFRWVARTAVVFSRLPLVGSSVGRAWRLAAQFKRGLAFGFPFPPFGSLYDCEALPFRPGPLGLTFPAADESGWTRPSEHELLVPWGQTATLRFDGLVLVGPAGPLHAFGSKASASATLAFLEAIRGEPKPKDAWTVVERAYAPRFDLNALDERLRAWRRWQWPVRVTNSALFLGIFGSLGLYVFAKHPPHPLLVLSTVFGLWLLALVTNVIAVRKTLPKALRPGGGQLAVMFISPLSLIRSFDFIEPELVGGFEPELVAAAVLEPSVAARFVDERLRQLEHALAPAELTLASPELQAQDERLRRHLSERLRRLVREKQLPPPPAPPKGRHCPRCLAEYGVQAKATSCSSCAAVALVG